MPSVDRHPTTPAPGWAPLLVLGLSVCASVVLISTCMAMIGTDGDHAHAGVPAAAPETRGR